MRATLGAVAMLALAGCGTNDDGADSLGTVTVDTLAGGVISVASSGPTAWADTNGWRLVEAGRIGGTLGGPGELIDPQSAALDGAGRVYVADRSPAAIKIFDADGSFIRSVGREGSGPGEFRAAFVAVRGEYMAVHDPRESRTSVFDTAGTFLRSWTSSCCFYTSIAIDKDFRIYAPLMASSDSVAIRYIRFDTLGVTLDTVAVPQLGESPVWEVKDGAGLRRMVMTVPYSPRTSYAIDPAGGLLFGWSANYQVARSETGSDTTLLFGRTWSAAPLSDERRRGIVDQTVERQKGNGDEIALRNAFQVDLVPTARPAFSAIVVDEAGNAWLMTDSDSTHARFDVFNPAGAYLGDVLAPVPIPAYGAVAWGRDVVYVPRESEEGLPYLGRYRVERGSDAN